MKINIQFPVFNATQAPKYGPTKFRNMVSHNKTFAEALNQLVLIFKINPTHNSLNILRLKFPNKLNNN